jgi:hypothetical protein
VEQDIQNRTGGDRGLERGAHGTRTRRVTRQQAWDDAPLDSSKEGAVHASDKRAELEGEVQWAHGERARDREGRVAGGPITGFYSRKVVLSLNAP